MATSQVAPQSSLCPYKTGEAARILENSLSEPEILVHPNEYYQALRQSSPVHYDSKLGMYLVSRYDDLQTVLRDPDKYSLELGWTSQFASGFLEEFKEIVTRDGGGYFPDAIMVDPPRHARIRRLLANAFTAHRVKQLEPMIARLFAERIEKFADKGMADAVTDFALPMAISIMCEQLGLDHADAEKIQIWSAAYTAQVAGLQSRETMVENARLVCEAQHYIIARVRERQAERREDMISDLVYARLDDEENPTLTFEEIVSLARALVVGGNETIATALSNILFCVATQPEIAAQLEESIEDDSKMQRFVEEVIRLQPPARATFRIATRETELGGVRVPAGACLALLYASANDDESVFESPRTFDPTRKNLGKHLAFGAGIHLCVGMSLARMEVKVGAREIIRRLKNIKLAIPVDEIRYVPTLSVLSMESLPISFSRR